MSVPLLASDSGYSPPLLIELELHGQRFNVAEMGPEFLRLRDAVPVAAGLATLRMEVDGRLTVYHVDLVDGIDPQRKRQPCQVQPPAGESADRPMVAAG